MGIRVALHYLLEVATDKFQLLGCGSKFAAKFYFLDFLPLRFPGHLAPSDLLVFGDSFRDARLRFEFLDISPFLEFPWYPEYRLTGTISPMLGLEPLLPDLLVFGDSLRDARLRFEFLDISPFLEFPWYPEYRLTGKISPMLGLEPLLPDILVLWDFLGSPGPPSDRTRDRSHDLVGTRPVTRPLAHSRGPRA